MTPPEVVSYPEIDDVYDDLVYDTLSKIKESFPGGYEDFMGFRDRVIAAAVAGVDEAVGVSPAALAAAKATIETVGEQALSDQLLELGDILWPESQR